MGGTYRTLINGTRVNSDGQIVDAEQEAHPICHEDVTITGTQMQGMNAAPVTVVSLPTGNSSIGKAIVPIAWCVKMDHAGGTDFSGNDDIELITGTDLNVLGEATGAIAGSADKYTTGTIVSGNPVVNDYIAVRVKTGEATGGHATASFVVRVYYFLL
jgi:hypothetical protein